MHRQLVCLGPFRSCLLAGLLASFFPSALATDVVTETFVGSLTTIERTTNGNPHLTLFSQRMVRSVECAGQITSVLAATLTDTNSIWTASQFGTNGTPAYVEFDNGRSLDIQDTVTQTHGLLLAGVLNGIASAGDAYRIRPHSTIASLFGTNNEAGLIAGPNPAQADTILLVIPGTSSIRTLFYFSNTPAFSFQGWARADTFTPDPDEVVRPEQGVMVQRIVNTDASLYLCGPTKTGETVVTVKPGYNLLGTLKSLSSVTLSNLDLYTGDPATGIVSGANPSSGDNLLVVEPNGSVTTYFYFYNPKNDVFRGWVNANGFSISQDTPIAAGNVFFINRQAGNQFDWTIPAE